ncbi:MAG TPA: hypothetical protein PLB92_00485 [Rhodoglobus sp.]|nr:hypothetical protein [Rhodoglobus sp.]
MGDYSIGKFPTRLVPRFLKRVRADALSAPDGSSVLELQGVPSAVNPLIVKNAASGEGPTISAATAINVVSDLIVLAGAATVNGSTVLTPAIVAALASKVTPVDDDVLALFDSAASGAAKKLSVADLKAVVAGLIAAAAQPRIVTGTVATAAATAAKTVTLDSPWASYTPVAGDMIALTYTSGQSANAAAVAINGGSAIAVRSPAGSTANTWHNIESGGVLLYRYDGTYLRHQVAISMADITEANIINPASGSWGFITGARAAYLKRKAIKTTVTSSATPAISLDLGDWSTISVGHNITAITTTGTGHDLQTVNLKLVGTGAFTLAFGSTWNFGFGVSAPASIANAKAIYIFGRWNSTTSKIDVLDVKQEA